MFDSFDGGYENEVNTKHVNNYLYNKNVVSFENNEEEEEETDDEYNIKISSQSLGNKGAQVPKLTEGRLNLNGQNKFLYFNQYVNVSFEFTLFIFCLRK